MHAAAIAELSHGREVERREMGGVRALRVHMGGTSVEISDSGDASTATRHILIEGGHVRGKQRLDNATSIHCT